MSFDEAYNEQKIINVEINRDCLLYTSKLVGESLFFEQFYCIAELRAVVQDVYKRQHVINAVCEQILIVVELAEDGDGYDALNLVRAVVIKDVYKRQDL